jgi:NTE family protein
MIRITKNKKDVTNYMKNKYALALGGGGTRGAYQVGVWRAIRELDVDIVAITGTSIGAINAALMVQGNHQLLEDIYNEIEMNQIMAVSKPPNPEKDLFNIANLTTFINDYFKQKGINNAPLREMLLKYLDLDIIYDSNIEYGLTTFDIDEMIPVDLFKDDIKKDEMIEYIMASACLPIFKPEIIGNKKYIDGGAGDNLPINMLLKKGYKNIIAVDLHGMGIVRKLNDPKAYIKLIKPSESLGGVLEFNKEKMKNNAQIGYMDTMKAFCKLQGKRYYFKVNEYKRMLNQFQIQTLLSLEFAAMEYEMDYHKIYTQHSFFNKLLKIHKKAMNEFDYMKKNIVNIKVIYEKLNKGEKMINKNVILCYFFDQIRNNPLYLAGKDANLFHEHIEAGRALLELEHFYEKTVIH